jgi:hypothetical protein
LDERLHQHLMSLLDRTLQNSLPLETQREIEDILAAAEKTVGAA